MCPSRPFATNTTGSPNRSGSLRALRKVPPGHTHKASDPTATVEAELGWSGRFGSGDKRSLASDARLYVFVRCRS